MNQPDRIRYLKGRPSDRRAHLPFGIWPLTMIWPSGWAWHTEGRCRLGAGLASYQFHTAEYA
jgi:hypothetical protein